MDVKIFWPWKIEGRFADGTEVVANGSSEEDCIEKLSDMQKNHGDLMWYGGYGDEDYVDGEYIGRENFIYD